VKYRNTDLLNRLAEMQKAPYYAACPTLLRAELAIVKLEQENAELLARLAVAAEIGKGMR
jgi:hypothetical protein